MLSSGRPSQCAASPRASRSSPLRPITGAVGGARDIPSACGKGLPSPVQRPHGSHSGCQSASQPDRPTVRRPGTPSRPTVDGTPTRTAPAPTMTTVRTSRRRATAPSIHPQPGPRHRPHPLHPLPHLQPARRDRSDGSSHDHHRRPAHDRPRHLVRHALRPGPAGSVRCPGNREAATTHPHVGGGGSGERGAAR